MIPKQAVDAFRSIVGEEWCLDSPEDLATYSYDAFLPEFKPDVVILPGSTEEIVKIMKVASREGIPVTPRGAGTNICGGSVAKRRPCHGVPAHEPDSGDRSGEHVCCG